MKQSFSILPFILSAFLIVWLTDCKGTGGNGRAMSGDADSIYTWSCIKRIHLAEPARSLALTDTAEQKGLMSPDSCDYIRALIYYGATSDYRQAEACCRRVLDRQHNDSTASFYLETVDLLAAVYLSDRLYEECLNTCLRGAALAHQAGIVRLEAEFNFLAGTCMERITPGSGIRYMNRSIDIFRCADNTKALPMLSYYLGQKSRYLAHLGQYAEAARTCEERLAVIERIRSEFKDVPDGFIDEQLANVYSVLAYCQHQTGAVAEARQSVAAFRKTRVSETPKGMNDILNYYALAGDAPNVLRIYDRLAPLYAQGDTVNAEYLGLIQNLAEACRKTGDFRRADLAEQRAFVLADSLNQREKQTQSVRFAQLYRTQEKELQLKDREAEARIYRILLICILSVLLLTCWYLWRFYMHNRVLTEKNRHLYEQVQQHEQQEAAQIRYLQSKPEAVLTQDQQLYCRLCKLMDTEQPYTEEDLNRETLAQKLGTNYKYVEQVIRECSNGETVTEFINRYRIQRIAHVLKTTDDSIGLICETCGIGSRPTLSRLFRDYYGMTPSEYRKVSRL